MAPSPATAAVPALADCVRISAGFHGRWGLGAPPSPFGPDAPGARRQRSQSDGGAHRPPECEDARERGPRGYDSAKPVKGRKRHVAVDTSGLLLGVLVHAADIQDADGACDLRRRIKPLSCWLEAVFADSAYHRLSLMIVCFLLGLTLIIVRRIADATGFVVLPRRWGVERTPGWLGRWRLARPLAALVQRLRGAARGLRNHGHPCHDPDHAASAGSSKPKAAPHAHLLKRALSQCRSLADIGAEHPVAIGNLDGVFSAFVVLL